MAKVTIQRDKDFTFRKYKLFIDDQKPLYINRGGLFELDTPQGKHHLTVKLDWVSSKYSFDIKEDGSKEIFIKRRFSNSFFLIFIAGYFIMAILSFLKLFLSYLFIIFPIWTILFFIPQLYVLIAKSKNYFIIKDCKD